MDLAGLGVDGQPFVQHPTERHVRRRSRTNAARPRRADRRPRPAPTRDRPVLVEVHLRARERARTCNGGRGHTRVEQRAPTRSSRRVTHGRRPLRGAHLRSAPRVRRARLPGATTRSTARARRHARPLADLLDAVRPVDRRDERSDVARDDARDLDAPSRYRALAAIGGRLGPRRTTSSREEHHAPRDRSGRRARGRRLRPVNRPCPRTRRRSPSGDAGSPPGSHHDASGSRYAGSTQPVTSRTPPGGSTGRSSGGRASTVVRRPCTFPARTRASNSDSATTHDRPAASTASTAEPGGRGTATSASRGRGRRRNRPRRAAHLIPRPGSHRLRASPGARRRRGHAYAWGRSAARARRRPSASPCSDTGARQARGRDRCAGPCPWRAAPPPAPRSPACRTRTATRRSPRTRPRGRRG